MARELSLKNIRTLFRHVLRVNLSRPCENRVKHLGHGCARAVFGQNWSNAVQELSVKFNARLTVMAECFEKQCSFLFVQRMKRAAQLFAFYNRLYGERLVDQFGDSFLHRTKRPLCFLLGSAFFAWEEHKISDGELNSCVDDMVHIQELIAKTRNKSTPAADKPCSWQKIIDRPHLIVWRRPLDFNPSLFQYKVYGTFEDVPARAFFNTQIDVDFWKQWDKHSEEIKIVDRHEGNGSEIVQWTLRFPYPMYCRDYVYVRKYQVDPDSKIMALYSRSVAHPYCPVRDDVVRVTAYQSALVIKPFKDFDENGFEYVLTYYDDPQTTFPTMCYNWMASTGVHEFVEKLHMAAKQMDERTQTGYRPTYYNSQDQNNHGHFTMGQTQQYA